MPNWNQPQCERCWVDQHTNSDGTIREPVRVRDVEGARVCAFCGYPTWAGIFVRADPSAVPYPEEEG